LTSGLTCRTTL